MKTFLYNLKSNNNLFHRFFIYLPAVYRPLQHTLRDAARFAYIIIQRRPISARPKKPTFPSTATRKAPSQVPLVPQLTPPILPLPLVSTTNRHNDLQRASVCISNSLRPESGEPTCPAGEERTSLTPSLGAQVQPTNPRGYHADAGSHP